MTHFEKIIVLRAGTWTADAPPVRGARRVWGLWGENEARPCGWLMPQIGEVDEKTRRFEEAKRRREARAIANRVAQRWSAS